MYMLSENFVRRSIEKIGGVTRTSNLLGVSNGCVHSWIKKRKVSNIDFARKLAELSGVPLEKIRPVR